MGVLLAVLVLLSWIALLALAGVVVAFQGIHRVLAVHLDRHDVSWWWVVAALVAPTVAVTAAAVAAPESGGRTLRMLFGAGLLLWSTALVGNALGRWPEYELLRTASESKTGTAAVGDRVVVTGTVEPADGTTDAPLSNAECVLWECLVEKKHYWLEYGRIPTEQDWGPWTTQGHATDGTSFLLDDGSGQVSVDPAGALVDVSSNHTFLGNGASATARDALSDGTLDLPGDASRWWRYSEGRVEPGDHVSVVGRVVQGEPGSPTARALAVDGDPLLVVDDPVSIVTARLRRSVVRGGAMGVLVGLVGVASFAWGAWPL